MDLSGEILSREIRLIPKYIVFNNTEEKIFLYQNQI